MIARGCAGTGLDCVPVDQWPLWQRLGFDWQFLGPGGQVMAVAPAAAMLGVIAWVFLWRRGEPDDMTPAAWAYVLAGLAVAVTWGLIRVAWNDDAWSAHHTAMAVFAALALTLALAGAGYLARLFAREGRRCQ